MTPLTSEWVDKAEGDLDTALRELRARIRPNYDSACFHAQQCAEKYLKARLQEAGIAFDKAHNLMALLTLCLSLEPFWSAMSPQAISLTTYAVGYRYPGQTAIRADAKAAMADCKIIRTAVRTSLSLPLLK